MNIKDLKVGDFAVNVVENSQHFTIGKKYPIRKLEAEAFKIEDDDGDLRVRMYDDKDWTFEPNLARLNTQSAIVEVTTKVLVTYEKTEIENEEEYLIKTIELADIRQLRKDIEHEVCNLSDPEFDIINVKWENQ